MARQSSYPRICIALGVDDPRKLLRYARDEADEGNRFFEFRLDYLKEPAKGTDVIRTFLGEYPGCQVLATCRREANHGHFTGSLDEQFAILDAAISAGSGSVDVEIESAEKARSAIRKLHERAGVIISYHNFSATPVLEPILRRMSRVPASAYKIVTMAKKPSDNGRLLSLVRTQTRTPLIVMAMGAVGFPSRVLSPVFGGMFTYAARASGSGTAPGQVSAHVLRHLYRLEKLARTAKIYGVIADPVAHSISPNVHNRAFQARRLDGVYLPFLVEPRRLKDFFELATQLPLAGFSVTIPHKEKVIRHLDVVAPLARRIGAVNTVWRKAGKWRGTNTDVDGVVIPLGKHVRLAKSSVLVVGSGGAARGAAFALADQGAKVTITGRDEDRAQILALARASGADVITRGEVDSHYFDALVHATPLGMHPRVDECFFSGRIPADVVLDMVYNPLETALLARARQQKKAVVPGTRMFLEQATRQFEIWTGGSAPRTAMERAMMEALENR